MLSTFILVFAAFVTPGFAQLGCRNENGELVDWYALYKLPRLSKSTKNLEQEGEAYSYIDPSQGDWVESSKSVEDVSSFTGKTYTQVLKNKDDLAYLVYNDQLPKSLKSSSYWGHTKGILATDGKTGFWMVHSVPRFPDAPSAGPYDYPENAKEKGQSVLCITFPFDQLSTIVNLFRFTRPQIYAHHSIPIIDTLSPKVKAFFQSQRRSYIKAKPFNITSTIRSRNNQTFVAFAKATKWGEDLYDDMVAPSLRSNLYVQSWTVGAGTPLETDCQDQYHVYNVETMDMKYSDKTDTRFNTHEDHSKWAAAMQGSAPWVCIGDINRMKSQFKRGGGTVCFQSQPTWKAYTNIITDFEPCPLP